jgi:hypothetical protein
MAENPMEEMGIEETWRYFIFKYNNLKFIKI